MKSLTTSVALLNSMTKVPAGDTTTTTLLTDLWNDSIKTICSIRSGKWWFLQTTTDITTVASQQNYAIPAGVRKLIDVYVTVGTSIYRPQPIYSPEAWNAILSAKLGESDVAQFYFVQGNEILIEPTPASNSNTITVRGRKSVPDLTVDDDTVTVTHIANGSTAVTISSGGLVSMAGKYLRITAPATGAADAGDGQWYEIASAPVAGTSIVLVAPYEGVTLSGATATATVAQMSPIPEAYDMAPIYRTLALFYQVNAPESPRIYNTYWKLYDGGQEAGLSTLVGGLIGQMLESEGESIEGAYVPPIGSTDSLAYGALWYEPRQDASGF
tara:strand:- start:18997 stop:19980 length:984 start_codon:yes stop_codon:yes gene_type:complete